MGTSSGGWKSYPKGNSSSISNYLTAPQDVRWYKASFLLWTAHSGSSSDQKTQKKESDFWLLVFTLVDKRINSVAAEFLLWY